MYAEDNVVGGPDVVIQTPLDPNADVMEYAVKTLYAVGEVNTAPPKVKEGE